MSWVLAIDLGNGGPKVAAISGDGRQVLVAAQREVSVQIGTDGTATQDAAEWTTELLDTIRDVLIAVEDPRALRAIGITGQWGSTVPVGDDGHPVGPVLLWADTRARRYLPEVYPGPLRVQGFSPQRVLRWVRSTGGAPTPSGADPTGHSLLLQREYPDVYARTRYLIEPVDYLGLRLTGRVAGTPASMILSWLTDNRAGRPLGYDPTLVRWARRDPGRLPPLIPTGSILGDLRADVAADLGLPAGVPVAAGIPDLHAAILGSGRIEPYATHIAVSTTSWISSRVPFRRTDIWHSMATVPGLDPTYAVVANNQETGGAALRWWREQVAGGSYDDLVAEAEGAPAGCEGLRFTPWLDGERSPVEDKDIRGSFLRVGLRTDRAAMTRAVLEGVALNSRWLMDTYERFLRRPVDRVRILGGGAQSDLWCSIFASVLDRPVEQVADPRDAQLRGVALWALVSLGELTLDQAAQRVPVAATYLPGDRAAYAEAYADYRRLYRALRRLRSPVP